MSAILAGVITAVASMFAKEGMNLLEGAVKSGGKKAIDLIEKKTGIDIKDIADPNTESQLSPEQVVQLKEFEKSTVLDLAKIVAGADANKAGGIIVASIAPEIPEMILFGMGLVMILGFAIAEILKTGTVDVAENLAGIWLGAFAMYVKGK